MLSYKVYTELVDEIIESGNISKALIEEAAEDSMTCVQKHIGHCIKVLMDTGAIEQSACNNFLNVLLKKHGGPHPCIPHAIAAIDSINYKMLLYAAINTHYDGRFAEDPEDFGHDDFGAVDPFIDINS